MKTFLLTLALLLSAMAPACAADAGAEGQTSEPVTTDAADAGDGAAPAASSASPSPSSLQQGGGSWAPSSPADGLPLVPRGAHRR